MSRLAKIELLLWGTLLGFLIFDLMEKQKRENMRLQALRNKFHNSNGLQSDYERLAKDWQNIGQDLHIASEKQLSGFANETY